MAVDARLRTTRSPNIDAQLRGDARGRDGGIREKLAVGMTAFRLLGIPEMRPIGEPIQRVLNPERSSEAFTRLAYRP